MPKNPTMVGAKGLPGWPVTPVRVWLSRQGGTNVLQGAIHGEMGSWDVMGCRPGCQVATCFMRGNRILRAP